MIDITKTIGVIGAGPAGMMAAIMASSPKNKVILFEKMEQPGSKLIITGKGKCNLTHQISKVDEIFDGYPGGAQFLHSAINKFSPFELIKFFETRGLKCKPDRGKRIFPVSENAKDVRRVLMEELHKKSVEVRLSTPIVEILTEGKNIKAVKTASKEIVSVDRLIVTTGGMSYPWTGSTGDGYIFAKKMGHKIVTPRPSLVSLTIEDASVSFALEGVSLKNVKAMVKADNKVADSKTGEMVFTSYGISGPIILYLSRQIVKLLAEGRNVVVSIDFKPFLSREKILQKLDTDTESSKKLVKNLFEEYLPQKVAAVFLQKLAINPNKQALQLGQKDKNRFAELIKNFNLVITKPRGISEAEVTQGGIDLREVDPRTMQSKVINGLYFAGEVLDVDGIIGGFNLQAAFSTGFVAGKSAAV